MSPCPHTTVRQLGGGHCYLCDELAPPAPVPQPSCAEKVAEILRRGRKARVKLMRRDLAAFVRGGAWDVIASTSLEWNWHHETLCRHLQYQIDEWRYRRLYPKTPAVMQYLAGNICPGSAKSHITSVILNAWIWLETPEWRGTFVSSNDAVVKRDHDYFAKLITSDWYQRTFRPTWTIESNGAVRGLVNTLGGTRLSRSLLSAAVGLRGDALIIDDADDPKLVHSPAYRAERDAKWSLVWSTRVNDLRISTFTSIQQVVHAQGFTSLLIPPDGSPSDWTHLCIPLRWRPGLPETPIGVRDPRTIPGEVMHPERFTPSVIAKLQRTMGTIGFELQFDQLTKPSRSKYFPVEDWNFFQRGELPQYAALYRPDGCNDRPARGLGTRSVLREHQPAIVDDLDTVVISVDASFGANTQTATGEDGSSRCGLGVMGARGDRRLILDDRTEQLDYPALKVAVKRLLADYPEAVQLLIEEKANGAALIQELRRDPDIRIEIVAIIPTENKLARAIAHSPAFEAGLVELLDGAAWVPPLTAEFAGFTGKAGERDDRVDWVTQALQHLAGEGVPWWMRGDEGDRY